MKHIVVFVAAVTFAGLLAQAQAVEAGGGGGGGHACQNDQKVSDTYDGIALELTVRDSCFGPGIARIAPGTELRWVNRGQQVHNIVDLARVGQPRELQPGATLTMTFMQAGAFVYYCAYHPGMAGAVLVGDSLGDSNPELVSARAGSKAVAPATAPNVASLQQPSPTDDGVPALAVVLVALAVGMLASGGSTLLVRRLDRR